MDKDDALPCGGMPSYGGNNFISEEVKKSTDQKSSGYNIFGFIPRNFPNFSLFGFSNFGTYTSVIPEETEDAVQRSGRRSRQSSLSEEVKKLGITGQTPAEETHAERFEPYWTPKEPKVKGHVRRHSSGLDKTDINKDMEVKLKSSSVDDMVPIHPSHWNEKLANDLIHQEKEHQMKMSKDALNKGMVDFSAVKFVPGKNVTGSALGSTDTAIQRLGNIFRKYEEHNMSSAEFNQGRIGEVFRVNSGMKRSSSAGCLQKLQSDVKPPDEIVRLQDKLSSEESDLNVSQPSSKTLSMRRTSSTGCLQRLQTEHLDSHENAAHTSDLYGMEGKGTKSKDSSSDNPGKLHNSMKDLGGEWIHNASGQLRSFGKQSVEWATTKKVHQKRRERQMISPTSF